MTDRNIVVRDLIVHRYMDRYGLPNEEELIVQRDYSRFRQQNGSAFDYLEELAIDLGSPKFVEQLDRLTNEFCEYQKQSRSQ
jgi:hypothetical protein